MEVEIKSFYGNLDASDLQYEVKTDANGKEHYHTKGFVAVGNKDKVGDVIAPKAFDDMDAQLKSGDVQFFGSWDHEHIKAGDHRMPPRSRIINSEVREKNGYKGLYIEDELNPYHPEFENYKNMFENKWLTAYSIEFMRPRADEFEKTEDGRILNKVNLTGYGHTGRPINPECELTDFVAKSAALIDEYEAKGTCPTCGHNHSADTDERAAEPVSEKSEREVKMADNEKKEVVETPVETPEAKAVVDETPEVKPEVTPEVTPEPETPAEEPTDAEPESTPVEAKADTDLEAKMRAIVREEIKSLKADAKNLVPKEETKFEKKSIEGKSFADIVGEANGVRE